MPFSVGSDANRSLSCSLAYSFQRLPPRCSPSLCSPPIAQPARQRPQMRRTTTQNLPAEIRSKLEQDGFTDVNVVPGSFLVSAKDKSGDPVTMVIGPNSMMMLTQVPSSKNATTGALPRPKANLAQIPPNSSSEPSLIKHSSRAKKSRARCERGLQ